MLRQGGFYKSPWFPELGVFFYKEIIIAMAELSLMASATFSPGTFHQDLTLLRPPQPKEFHAFSLNYGKRQNILSSGGMQIATPHSEDQWKFSSLCSDNQLFGKMAVMNKPVLIDVQDARPDLVLFSFGVAEQCTRHEKILKFLTSNSNITDGNDLNISLISDLMGFQSVAADMCPQPHIPMGNEFCLYDIKTDDSQKVILPQKQLYVPQSILEFVGNLSQTSSITVHPNGHVLFTGSTAEMKDLLSIIAEFNVPSSLSNGSRKAMVVPYFTRKRGGHARAYTKASSSVFGTQTVDPSKSSVNSKPPQKKKLNKNLNSERFSKNYFYACDCLINMYLDKNGNRMTILSLKDSGPMLTQLLSQFSAGIAGMGLAVLFTVAYKALNGRIALLTSAKLFSVTFGFGLFWLSRAVSRLRDTIYSLSRRSARGKEPHEETSLVKKVKISMDEILIRFAALMFVGVLSF